MAVTQKGFAHLLALFLLLIGGLVLGVFLVQKPQPFSPKAAEVPTKVAVYKLYDPKYNTWYWTDNQNDINNLVAIGYRNDGILFYAFKDQKTVGSVPLYRLSKFNDNILPVSQVFLTANKDESDQLQSMHQGLNVEQGNKPGAPIWTLIDEPLYVFVGPNQPAGSIPVYRLKYFDPSNPDTFSSNNLSFTLVSTRIPNDTRYYSADLNEIHALVSTGKYINEGIAFFGAGDDTQEPTRTVTSPNFVDKTLAYCNENNVSRIHLEWTQVPGAVSYKIFRVKLGETSDGTFIGLEHYAYNDETVIPGATYSYTIQAVGNGTSTSDILGTTKSLTAVVCKQ